MDILYISFAVIVIALLCYLVIAFLKPEIFP